MGYVLESKQENGQTKDVFVYKMDDDTQVPTNDQQLQDQLVKASLKMALEGVIDACQAIGSTDGQGGSQSSGSGYSDYDLNPKQMASQAAVNAAQKIVEVSDKAVEQAAQQVRLTQKPIESTCKTLVNLVKDLKAAEAEHAHNHLQLKELTAQNSNEVNPQLQVNQIHEGIEKLASSKDKVDGIKKQIEIHTHIYKLALNNHIQSANQYLQSKEDLTQAQQKVNAVTGTDATLKNEGNIKSSDPAPAPTPPPAPAPTPPPAPAPSPDQQDFHKFLKDHNVFYDLLMVSMKGNSSIFGIVSAALGKISNLLAGNQDVTAIITKLNNDLKQLISGGKPGTKATSDEIAVMEDLQLQLKTLENYINPQRSDFFYPPGVNTKEDKEQYLAQVQQAHDSMGDTLCNQMETLVGAYSSEFSAATGGKEVPGDQGALQFIIDQMESGKSPSMTEFTNFYNDMVNESGDKTPSGSATNVYSDTSNAVTSLNTAGSQFMAEQNLETKQIDQVEKVWTNGFSTMTSAMNSVINNIAG
jgi:hypothetical protein